MWLQEHLNKFYATRTEKLKGMQGTNRAKQTASPEAGVPTTGSTWDKVCITCAVCITWENVTSKCLCVQ